MMPDLRSREKAQPKCRFDLTAKRTLVFVLLRVPLAWAKSRDEARGRLSAAGDRAATDRGAAMPCLEELTNSKAQLGLRSS